MAEGASGMAGRFGEPRRGGRYDREGKDRRTRGSPPGSPLGRGRRSGAPKSRVHVDHPVGLSRSDAGLSGTSRAASARNGRESRRSSIARQQQGEGATVTICKGRCRQEPGRPVSPARTSTSLLQRHRKESCLSTTIAGGDLAGEGARRARADGLLVRRGGSTSATSVPATGHVRSASVFEGLSAP